MEIKSEETVTLPLSASRENVNLWQWVSCRLQPWIVDGQPGQGNGSGSGAEREQNPTFGLITRCGFRIRPNKIENTTQSS